MLDLINVYYCSTLSRPEWSRIIEQVTSISNPIKKFVHENHELSGELMTATFDASRNSLKNSQLDSCK